jgi:DNA (cytosine-5)-methyltransferase 1
MTRYKTIDLFAGIGGLRLGFDQTRRTETVFSSEIDKFARQTYQENFGTKPGGDITKIEASDIPDHDILLAGFPCQAFSHAGLKKGFEDTRGTLFFDVARILKEKRPKAFLLENVKGLIAHDKGNTLKVILETLNQLGYDVQYKVLNTKDFGLPQNRERIYLVGFLKSSVSNPHLFDFPIGIENQPQKFGIFEKALVGDILEENVSEKYTISDKAWDGLKRRKKRNLEAGKGFGYSLVNPESEYTRTLVAHYCKDGNEILLEQEGKNPRKLTERECARLQGFPEDFILPCSKTQTYKQLGNSVTVPVIYKIAQKIIMKLDKDTK